jgi:hypothetical protein
MRVPALLLLMLLTGLACTDTYRVPSDVIPRKKMEKMLWELIQADRYEESFRSRIDSTDSLRKLGYLRLYEQVFKVNDVSREEFFHSYRFYLSHPNITSVMLDSIARQSERMRDELYKREPK